MLPEDRRAALKKIDPSNYGIYDAEVKLFLQYFDDMERVKELADCTSLVLSATKRAASTTSCAPRSPSG